jgi:PPP family 3-phenylpropionic acid transporter
MPKVLTMVGYSASDVGIIFAAGPMVRFLLPFAFIKGLKLNHKSFNIALIIMVISTLSFYYSLNNFYPLLISSIGLGVGLSLILPYIEVISLGCVGKGRYGKIRLFGSLGFILVALVLVKFLSSADVALNYLLTLSLFTSVVAFFIVKNQNIIDGKKSDVQNDVTLLKDWRLWLGLTLMQVSFGAFYNFFTIYETDFGVSMDMTIYLWSFGVVVEVFMLFFQGRFLHKNLLTILQITTFASAIRWFLLFLFPQNLIILFFAQSLHALSFALFHSAAISYLFHLYKHKSLAQQFFSGITYGLGGFVGALSAGYIYELYPKYLFLSATFIALMACKSLYNFSKTSNNQ